MQRCYHHLISRGAGGPDEKWNLLSVCQSCHVWIHKIGLLRASQRFPEVEKFLIKNGWELILNKWRHF